MHVVSILQAVLHELDPGRKVALGVIVATKGSTPQPAGVMVCVDEAARMTGTLGGGCIEAGCHGQAAGAGMFGARVTLDPTCLRFVEACRVAVPTINGLRLGRSLAIPIA